MGLDFKHLNAQAQVYLRPILHVCLNIAFVSSKDSSDSATFAFCIYIKFPSIFLFILFN